MQFLLLLSALMSALSGAFTGPRVAGTQMDQVEAQQFAPTAVAAQASAIAEEPTGAAPVAVTEVAAAVAPADRAPILAPPLADIRLNE